METIHDHDHHQVVYDHIQVIYDHVQMVYDHVQVAKSLEILWAEIFSFVDKFWYISFSLIQL